MRKRWIRKNKFWQRRNREGFHTSTFEEVIRSFKYFQKDLTHDMYLAKVTKMVTVSSRDIKTLQVAVNSY